MSPECALIKERLERSLKDGENLRAAFDAHEAKLSAMDKRSSIDRGVLDRASTHTHRNNDVLYGEGGIVTRVALLERVVADSIDTNKKLRNHALTILVVVIGKVVWDVLTKTSTLG